jgi:hypothetical protein
MDGRRSLNSGRCRSPAAVPPPPKTEGESKAIPPGPARLVAALARRGMPAEVLPVAAALALALDREPLRDGGERKRARPNGGGRAPLRPALALRDPLVATKWFLMVRLARSVRRAGSLHRKPRASKGRLGARAGGGGHTPPIVGISSPLSLAGFRSNPAGAPRGVGGPYPRRGGPPFRRAPDCPDARRGPRGVPPLV